MSESLAQQIAELEEALKHPLSDVIRKRTETDLAKLRVDLARLTASVSGEVNLHDNTEIDGVAVGMNYGSINYSGGSTPLSSTPTGPSLTLATEMQIANQRERLKVERGNLAHYLRQYTILDSTYVEPSVTLGIQEARTAIKRIKTTLRRWRVAVDDHPDDEAA